jgi:L-ascorbate metabolism protein UlaG (beta-lactamase superfamily)
MKITKFGHSCLLVEEKGARFIVDPGNSSGRRQDNAVDIDAILITHDHPDHWTLESVQELVKNNLNAKIFTTSEVSKKLKEHGIASEVLAHKQKAEVKGVVIEGWGKKHAMILKSIPLIENTGYFIGERFFYPGDAIDPPKKRVEILAFPATAPWMKISEAVEFGVKVRPRVAFPVHDAILKNGGPFYRIAGEVFAKEGIEWKVIEDGGSAEF